MRNKTVVLTGASAGIGAELAVALAKKGANLVLAARDVQALEDVKKRCEGVGAKAIVVKTDVTDPDACKAMIDRAIETFSGIDVLINNAGISMRAHFRDITDLSMFERLMRVNYLGTVYCTHHALPHLEKSRGLLVGISSLTGKTGVPSRTGYAASKHAMQGFLDSLRVELRPTGVDVLVVSPGFVSTDIRTRALGPDGKPRGEDVVEEGSDAMDVDTCVGLIVEGIEKRKREVIMTARAKVGLWVKLIAPSLVDRIAERATRKHSR